MCTTISEDKSDEIMNKTIFRFFWKYLCFRRHQTSSLHSVYVYSVGLTLLWRA